MFGVPQELQDTLKQHGQEHVLALWGQLDQAQRQRLLAEVQSIDLELLGRLYAERNKPGVALSTESIQPVPVIPHDAADREERKKQGELALEKGEVAVLV